MPSHFQQTVNLLEPTEHSLGPIDGLSTSDTARLAAAFNNSPLHSGEITRESIRSTFNDAVLNGPADVGPDGEVIKPPGSVLDNAGVGVGANGTGGGGGGAGGGGAGGGGAGGAGGAPNIGGEGGTPKGPNLLATNEMLSGEFTDDGLASPPVLGGLTQADMIAAKSLAGLPGVTGAGGAGAGGGGGGGVGGAGFAGGVGGGGAGGAGAAGGAGTGAGLGFGEGGANTTYGAGAPGAGGAGGSAGGSDNPASSSKIISGQEVGKLQLGSSTPTPCKIP